MTGRLFLCLGGAAACLLVLKGLALLHDAPPEPPAVARSGELPAFGRAIARARQGYVTPDVEVTGAVGGGGDKKDEKAAAAAASEAALDAARRLAKDALVAGGSARQARQSPSEQALLERLGERREELEQQGREAETRDALLRAAEKKLEARVGDLRSLEDKLQAANDRSDQSQAQTLKNLVTMYEAMKPKDAARVFDRLEHRVLIPVVSKMNPRKMSEILSVMQPEAAEKLTVALLTRAEAAASVADPVLTPVAPANELQRLDAPPRAGAQPGSGRP